MPYIVIGCGFCGANGLIKKLMDHGIFMGEKWMQPNKRMHPYPVFEDQEFFNVQVNFIHSFWVHLLAELYYKRCNKYGDNWGFKCPNNYLYLTYYLNYIKDVTIFACVRDRRILIDRMIERWNFRRDQTLKRINTYIKIVQSLIENSKDCGIPKKVIVINQKKLLEGKEDDRLERILESN